MDDVPYPQHGCAGAKSNEDADDHDETHGDGPLIQVVPESHTGAGSYQIFYMRKILSPFLVYHCGYARE